MAIPKTNSTLLRNLQTSRRCDDLWQHFYETYRETVATWSLRQGLTHDAAEDVMQVAMTKIFCNLHKYDRQRGRFAPWIKTIVMNEIRDRYRRQVKEPLAGVGGSTNQECVHELADVSDSRLERDTVVAEVFRRTSARVSTASWNIFIRSKILKEDAASLAREFGLKRASVYQSISRITRMLREECERAIWAGTASFHGTN